MNITIQLTGLHFKDLNDDELHQIKESASPELHIEKLGKHILVSGNKSHLYDLLWRLSTIYDLTII